MLVKIHSRGQGGGNGPIDYLLGKNRDRELATVLRGDPEQTKELIDSLSFSRNYTSGVMSFSESDLLIFIAASALVITGVSLPYISTNTTPS